MTKTLNVAALLVLAACSGSQPAQDLSARIANSLSRDDSCNRIASVQTLADGSLVRIPDATLFKTNQAGLTECGQYAVAGITEAMLDPRMMQVVIEPATLSPGYASLSLERAEVLNNAFSHAGFVIGQPPVAIDSAGQKSTATWGIRLAVTQPATSPDAVRQTTVSLFDGSYRVTIRVTGKAPEATGQNWCDSPGQPVITIANGQLTIAIPHPYYPGNPTLSLQASVYQDGSLSGQTNEGSISGQVARAHIGGSIDGVGCAYAFAGDRI